MPVSYETLYQQYIEPLGGVLGGEKYFDDFVRWIQKSENTLAMGRKKMEKQIDADWIEAIEPCLQVLDRVTRNPRKFIKDEKDILPIELSRNITAESVRHLAQHSNLIDRVDGDQVTPSKILNVYKEESLDTYENKFVNTLIDRLYLFVHRRYDRLREAGFDEACANLRFESELKTPEGGEVTLRFEIETKDRAEAPGQEGPSVWDRVERIRRFVDEIKRSPFVKEMKGLYVRPPIMRTNAIMKNQDLKQCLVLWQYIESYDKIGYELNVSERIENPDQTMVEELYELTALHYLLFRRYTAGETRAEALKQRKTSRPARPRIVKTYQDELVPDYNFYEVEQRKVMEQGGASLSRRKLSEDELLIRREITEALASEKKRKAKLAAEEKERERRRFEQERKRIESENRRERERLEREKRQRLRELAKEEQAKREEEWREKQHRAAQRRALEVARRAEERLERLREAARQKAERENRLREAARQARLADSPARQGEQTAWRAGGARQAGWKKH